MMMKIILAALLLPAATTTVLLASAGGVQLSEQSWKHRLQARRADVVRHLNEGAHRLRARASPTPCETTIDEDGVCCPTTALNIDMKCCPQENIYGPICGDPSCCENGQVFGEGLGLGCCADPGLLYTPVGGNVELCCETGVIAPDLTCCSRFQKIAGETCVIDLELTFLKRNEENSKSYMVKRSDSTRTLLSPDLVAEHLTNNGVFTYMGIEHIDKSHQSHNEGVFRRLAGRGINTAMKFAKRYTRDIDPEMWESLGDHFPISANYEFAIKDVPEIYAHMLAREDFDSFLWNSATFDRNSIYEIIRQHPTFNESLIAQYR